MMMMVVVFFTIGRCLMSGGEEDFVGFEAAANHELDGGSGMFGWEREIHKCTRVLLVYTARNASGSMHAMFSRFLSYRRWCL